MNVDFHVHGKLTKKSDFDLDFFSSTVACARECGLDAFVLSEHFNTKDFYGMYEQLERRFYHVGDAYLIQGLRVFTGMEVDVAGGGHVIVVANREKLLALRRKLDDHTTEEAFIRLSDLLEAAEQHQCLTIGAHPFRGEHLLARQDAAQLARLDALDFNATDVFTQGREAVQRDVEELAQRLGVNVVTGSDTHYPVQLGSVKTILIRDCPTVADMRLLIRAGALSAVISPALVCRVFAAKTAKAQLKAVKGV